MRLLRNLVGKAAELGILPTKGQLDRGMNDLQYYSEVLAGVTPWSGKVPAGCVVDFLGTVTSKELLAPWPAPKIFVDGAHVEGDWLVPTMGKNPVGEDYWFEAVNWIVAAREARERFVMMTLGALHGYQAIASCRALMQLNPMPYKLVAVEPIPENMQRLRRHMRDNGIDPAAQWLIEAAVSGSNEPAFFPVGAPNAGSQNCLSTDEKAVREGYLRKAVGSGQTEDVLRSLLLHNSTGYAQEIAGDQGIPAEIKLVSCITIGDLLGPFDRVDYIEADMQQSEIRAFPPFIDLLRRKVKRIHIATHGQQVHHDLHRLFASHGWDIVFSYAPETTHKTPWGPFTANDGVLTVVNPAL